MAKFQRDVPKLKKVIVWDLEGLRHFEVPMVMTYDELIELGKEVVRETPDLFEERINQTDLEDVAVLIYTSGTTVLPKGTMLSHINLVWRQRNYLENPMSDEDEVLSFYRYATSSRSFSPSWEYYTRICGQFYRKHGDGE